MPNQLMNYLKQNRKDIGIFALIGGGVYLFSKNYLTTDMSVLQSSFGTGILDKVVNLELQTLLLFIVLGISLGIIISAVIRKK